MNHPGARQLIAKSVSIPTLPVVVQKIERLLADPDVGAPEIGALIAEDAPLSAKVLKIANSSYYGLQQPCIQAQQATTVLGIRILRNVVMQAAVIRQFDHLRGGAFDIEESWRHSVVAAQTCRFLARKCTRKIGVSPDEAYTCGLLHDLGQIVMLDSLGQPFVEATRSARAERIPQFLAETRAFGFTHAEVGALIAEKWGLPAAVSTAIQHHHGPREAIAANALVALVATVNLVVERVAQENLAGAANVYDAATLRQLGISQEHVTETLAFVVETLATAEV